MHPAALTLAATLSLLAALPATAQQPAPNKKPPRAAPVAAAPALPPADSQQLAAAALTLFGDYACEFGKTLRVRPDPKFDGYIDMQVDRQRATLKPVLSHTGALRLEDVRGRLLLVQIATKSMVMDVKVGQRLVDDCVHETQSETRRRLAAAPPGPSLLGGEPDKPAGIVAGQAGGAAGVAAGVPATAPAQVPAGSEAATPAQSAASAPGVAVGAGTAAVGKP